MESWGTVELSLEIEELSKLIEMKLLYAELWIWLTLIETEDTEVDNWRAIADRWLTLVKLRWLMDEKALSAELVSLIADIEKEYPEEKSLSSNWEMFLWVSTRRLFKAFISSIKFCGLLQQWIECLSFPSSLRHQLQEQGTSIWQVLSRVYADCNPYSYFLSI